MLNRLFPLRADNASYRGSKIALMLFAVLVLLRAIMSINSILNGRKVATTADGIPLETFTPAGANSFVAAFATLGLSNLVICLIGAVVLIRYRALVPLMFTFFLLQHLARTVILRYLPIERVGAPPAGVIHLVLLSLMVVGLALSLTNWRPQSAEP